LFRREVFVGFLIDKSGLPVKAGQRSAGRVFRGFNAADRGKRILSSLDWRGRGRVRVSKSKY